jgi:hypothetical protein
MNLITVKISTDTIALGLGPAMLELTRGFLHVRLGPDRSGARELFWMWGGPTRWEFYCTLFNRAGSVAA